MSERTSYHTALYEIASNVEMWEKLCKVRFSEVEKLYLQEYLRIYEKHQELISDCIYWGTINTPRNQEKQQEINRFYEAMEELASTEPLKNVLRYRFNIKSTSEPKVKDKHRKEKIKKSINTEERNRERYTLFQLFLMSLSLTIALIMLNAPIWVITVATLLVFSPCFFRSLAYSAFLFCTYDILRPIIYVCALVVTAQGKQDFFAIAFYVLAALQLISILKRFIGTVCIIVLALFDRKN